jgi:hypothetical protein
VENAGQGNLVQSFVAVMSGEASKEQVLGLYLRK